MLAAAGALAALVAPAVAAAQEESAGPADLPRVTVMVMTDDVSQDELASLDGGAIGIMSAGIGNVAASQTYLDISQGARLANVLYDGDVPIFTVPPGEGVNQPQWLEAIARSEDTPSDVEPGLLATTLARAGIPTRASSDSAAESVIATDRGGHADIDDCADCPGLTVTRGTLDDAKRVVASMGPDDLLIAFERPPPPDDRELAVTIAGLGTGSLQSDSTRLDGLVLTTDLAPTILERFGIAVPSEMSGQALEAGGSRDLTELEDFEDRLAQVSPRRGEAVGYALLGWSILAGLLSLVFRGRAASFALRALAVSVAYLPAVFLLTAWIEPSETAERLIAWLGCPALAFATLAAFRGWMPLAFAAALTVGAEAVDVIVGSPLTSLSVLGPNPSLGVRFYGIGNELEAVLVALVLIGTGAALSGLRPNASPGFRAGAFAATGLLAVAAFAPGRFGADVGAAIGIPVGAAAAAAVLLGGGRRRIFLVLAAPVAILALLALADLVLGGDSHFSRSVLEAGGFDEVGKVAERRLRLGALSFEKYGSSPVLWATVALIVAGVACRRRIAGWFTGYPAAWAGFVGAAVATAVGTLANDSGALLLMVGTALTSMCVGYAWALRFSHAQASRQLQ